MGKQNLNRNSKTTTVIPILAGNPSPLVTCLLVLPIILLALLNLLLVFTPEMGFDALWYHLTLPKLWLLQHRWYYPGGLLYYSAMPRLAETLFIPLVQYTGTIGPKILQYLAGLGTGLIIWKILHNFKQNTLWKFLGVSLFYCTWLVSWQSGSAYIDLIRTFLEGMALYFFIKGSWKTGGMFLGLAIGTKWHALGSLAIYSVIFGPQIIFPALLVASPWFLLAYRFTGNPIYPLFSGITDNSFASFGSALNHLVFTPWYLTKPFDDFVSPVVGLIFICGILSLNYKKRILSKIAWLGISGSLLTMVLVPPSTRYFLPYLPALVISSIVFFSTIENLRIQIIFIWLGILSAFIILGLRFIAMQKYLPYLLGKVDTNTFLTTHYNRLPGTFVDTDGFVGSLPEKSKILVDKLHNLYYFPRDFDHTSWASKSTEYDYLVTIGETSENIHGDLIHTNKLGIQIYKLTK